MRPNDRTEIAMSTFYTSCRVVKTTQETFVQHVTVGDERRRVEFVKPIRWIQMSESQALFLHGGKVLREENTYNDFYGYLSSIDESAAEHTAKQFEITRESSLELVIRTTVFLSPARETEDTVRYNRDKKPGHKSLFAEIPWDWRQEVKDVENQVSYPRLARIEIASADTWSSKNSASENALLKESFCQKWAVREVSQSEPVIAA